MLTIRLYLFNGYLLRELTSLSSAVFYTSVVVTVQLIERKWETQLNIVLRSGSRALFFHMLPYIFIFVLYTYFIHELLQRDSDWSEQIEREKSHVAKVDITVLFTLRIFDLTHPFFDCSDALFHSYS